MGDSGGWRRRRRRRRSGEKRRATVVCPRLAAAALRCRRWGGRKRSSKATKQKGRPMASGGAPAGHGLAKIDGRHRTSAAGPVASSSASSARSRRPPRVGPLDTGRLRAASVAQAIKERAGSSRSDEPGRPPASDSQTGAGAGAGAAAAAAAACAAAPPAAERLGGMAPCSPLSARGDGRGAREVGVNGALGIGRCCCEEGEAGGFPAVPPAGTCTTRSHASARLGTATRPCVALAVLWTL